MEFRKSLLYKVRLADKITYIFKKIYDVLSVLFIIWGYYIGCINPEYQYITSHLMPIILLLVGIRCGYHLKKERNISYILISVIRSILMCISIISLALSEHILCLIIWCIVAVIYDICDCVLNEFITKTNNWNAAIHEAGHCIINEIEYQNSTLSAFICCSGTTIKGAMMADSSYYNEDVRKHIRILLAGVIAECIILGQPVEIKSLNENFILNILFTEAESSKNAIITNWKKSNEINYLYETFVENEYFTVKDILSCNKEKIIVLANSIYKNTWINGKVIRGIISKPIEN